MTGPCRFPETVLGPADLETVNSEARMGAKEAGAGRVQGSGLGQASGSKEGHMCRTHLRSQGLLKGHQGRSGDFIPHSQPSAAANGIPVMALVCCQKLTRNKISIGRGRPYHREREKTPRMRTALTFTIFVTLGKIFNFLCHIFLLCKTGIKITVPL